MDDDLRKLFEKWKAQGYVEYHEFKETLPSDIVHQDQIDDIATMINEMGIKIRKTKAKVIDLDSDKNNN